MRRAADSILKDTTMARDAKTGVTLSKLGEVGLIRRLARRLAKPSSVLVGIGDDAALVRGPRGSRLLFASDMVIEGVHFSQRDVPPQWIGWKALACNISDIAAMGGQPTHAVVSLGLPPSTPLRIVDGLYRGLARCARRFGVAIVGGDTVRAPVLVVDVAILGRVPPHGRVVLRSGARVGDHLFVTGQLGGSLASGWHARFIPRLREARWLLARVPIHAMMDVSDGLAADLWQLARASRVRIRIDARAIPIARGRLNAISDRKPALWHALMDGEDFELLFAVSPRVAARLPRRIGRVPLTPIGIVAGRGATVELVNNGRIEPIIPAGFRHF